MVKRNKLFRLHLHVDDEYIPASQFDIDFAQSLPFVVCSYSKNRNRTKVSLLYKIAGGENMFFGQKNEKTVLPTRDINLILGYYDHNDMMPALAQPYLGKPEMSVEPLSDTEYAIKCKTQAAPLMLEVWGIEGQNGIYHGSMKGTEDGDFDPPEYWRDYKRLDPETFQVKFRTPKGAKHPIFYFINYDYLGASWYGDEQVYASAA